MSIEERIKDLRLKKVLIADDKPENIEAAKIFFENKVAKYDVEITYVYSAKDAREKIKESFDSENKYGLVISDLDMEKKASGAEVFYDSWIQGIPCLIATGRGTQISEAKRIALSINGHGSKTSVYSIPILLGEYLLRPKTQSPHLKYEVGAWADIFNKSLDYMYIAKNCSLKDNRKGIFNYKSLPLNDKVALFMLNMYKNDFQTQL